MCQAVLRVDLLNEAALMKIAIICVPVLAEFLMKESKEQVRLLFKCLPTYPYGHKFNLWHCPFDSTKGHPGEGWRHAGKRKTRRELLRRKKRKDRWSKQFPNLKIATWNTRSLTVERFDYCKRLKYDALGLTELWRTQEKFLEANNLWTCSENLRDNHGKLVNDEDPGAGAGILLSARASKKVITCGNNGSERLCWVRLRGPSCNIYIICVYVPYRARVQPCQDDTLSGVHVRVCECDHGVALICVCVCVCACVCEREKGETSMT